MKQINTQMLSDKWFYQPILILRGIVLSCWLIYPQGVLMCLCPEALKDGTDNLINSLLKPNQVAFRF